MLAVILSWVVISIVFLSFGDFFIYFYNRIARQTEQYGLTDTFLSGMCFTLIPLAFGSLWLPSNHYIMFAYLVLSILYWILRKEHLRNTIARIKQNFTHFSSYHYLIIIAPIVSLIIAILWQVGVFDSLFYHQQNIRWNEEFAVVPGLGNLEDRFGFNSNYLLLSAIFSFRFLFGEAVYSLHVLVLVYVLCWILVEIIRSSYEIRRIALLLVFTGYIFIFGYTLTATSTDAIPNIVSFYLIAKFLLYPDSINKKMLLWVFVPVAMLTFKITILPLCLVALYLFYKLLKKKDFASISFFTLISIFVVGLWCVRNIIITGYLVFPFHEIDLFSVDWKMPKSVALAERDFILSCGTRVLDQEIIPGLSTFPLSINALKNWCTNFVFLGFAFLSPLLIIFAIVRKKYLDKKVYFAYIILMLIFGIWYLGSPDPRFIGGALFAIAYFFFFILLSTKQQKHYPKLGLTIISFFALLMAYWAVTRTHTYCTQFGLYISSPDKRPVSDALIRQYPYRESLRTAGLYVDEFIPYQMNENIIIYMSHSPEIPNGRFVCFESPFPGSAFIDDGAIKYLDVTDIEPRGSDYQDGFRPIVQP